jgi:gamma-glutamylcyclotransferase (GGCT)/AIG2-like uncharacterized protein YtfP
MPSDVIFVYGTLRSEFTNEYALLLRASADYLGSATVRGSIYRIAHYPAYREDPDGVVTGELYRLRDAETMFARLDAYEGEEFERVLTSSGWWIYRSRIVPPEESGIVSGDFLKPSAA